MPTYFSRAYYPLATNAGITSLQVPFSYIKKVHVSVSSKLPSQGETDYVTLVEGTDWDWASASQITLTSPLTQDIKIQRTTPGAALLAAQQAGVVSSSRINLTSTQLLYLSQEANDLYAALGYEAGLTRPRLPEVDIREFIGYSPDLTGATDHAASIMAAATFASQHNAWLNMIPETLWASKITLPTENVRWKSTGGKCHLKLFPGTNDDLVYGALGTGYHFKDILFDGNHSQNSRNVDGVSSNGLALYLCDDVVYEDLEFVDCWENGERTLGCSNFRARQCSHHGNKHNGLYRGSHLNGTPMENFYWERDYAYDNATDGMNWVEDLRNGTIVAPRAEGCGADTSFYTGGCGMLFYGGDTDTHPTNVTVLAPQTLGNHHGGLYINGGAEITVSDHVSINDGYDSVPSEFIFGHAFAVTLDGTAAHGADQTCSNIFYENGKIFGAGKRGVWAESLITEPIRELHIKGLKVENASTSDSGNWEGVRIGKVAGWSLLYPDVKDTQATKTMKKAVQITADASNGELVHRVTALGTGVSSAVSDNLSSSTSVECTWNYSVAFTMPTIASGAVYTQAGIVVPGVLATDILTASFNQGNNLLTLTAHPSADGLVNLVVENRGGGSFGTFAGTLRLRVHRTALK